MYENNQVKMSGVFFEQLFTQFILDECRGD